MAEDRMAVLEMLRKLGADGDVDFLREGVRVLAAALMEAEVTELTGVPKGERAPERRLTNRNGYRERRWDTRVGTIDLAIPKVRDGSYFPSLLEPRRRAERALLAVVCEAYVGRRQSPAGSRTSSPPWAWLRSRRARSAGCAPRSTPRSRPSDRVLSPASSTHTCGSTPPCATRRHMTEWDGRAHRRAVAAVRRSWGQSEPGDAGEGGKQPRQRRDGSALPDDPGPASKTERCKAI